VKTSTKKPNSAKKGLKKVKRIV